MDIVDASQWYFRLLLVTPRVVLAILFVPIFAAQLVPQSVRGAVGLSLVSVALLGPDMQAMPMDMGSALLMLILVKEAAIGLMIGLSFGMIFNIARVIGEIIDYQTASTFSQGVDPVNGQQTSTIGLFLEKVFIVFAIASGGLLLFADAILLSYELWPVDRFLPDLTSQAAPLLIRETSQLLALGLLLAGPMVLIAFMVDVAVGFLGRAAPTLNLLSISLPLKMPIALFVMMLALPFMLTQLYDVLVTVRNALISLMGG